MTNDDMIAAIRVELLRLRRDFEMHRSMPPNGATLDQVMRERDAAVVRCDAIRAQNEILESNVARLMCERDAARTDAADARAELKRRDEVTSQLQAENLRLRTAETRSEELLDRYLSRQNEPK
jgi:hypothetical protein